jgi:hypothetical protein
VTLFKLSPLLLSLCLLIGCSGLSGKNKGVNGKETKHTAALVSKVNTINSKSAAIDDERLTSIGAWSSGVDYSLQKETNQSPAVSIARELNLRVTALANKPDFDDLQAVYQIIDTFLTNQVHAEKMLVAKDKEILALNRSIESLQLDKEKQIAQAFKQSAINASQADQYKETLNEMDSFFGGGAIWYGVKKLVTRLMWVIGGGLVLYFVLRGAAMFSPIAASIFSIVNTLFGVVIKMVQGIAPKAAQAAGFIETKIFNDYKKTLTFVIDTIQMAKTKEKLGVNITMDMLEAEMAQAMDQADKDRITEIKKTLNWK